jgi:germacradienol/geosmin synthase
MGMLDPLPGAPGGVWSAESLAAFDPAYFAARLNEAMSADTLTLCTQWMTWATYADDYYFVKFGAARDLAAAKLQDRRLAALMRVDGSSPLAPESALEAGLGSLWQRTAPGLSVEHRAWLRDTLVDMLASWSWEIVNQSQHRIPDLVEYVEMRRKTYGSDFTVLLCLLTAGAEIPAEVLASQPVRSLTAAAHDYGCFVNDICSYRKEIELDGEIHNGVLVLENWLDIDLDRAIALLNALMTARVGQFEHVRTVELPALMDDLGLPAEARTAVRSYVDRLQNWMAALWAFNKTTRRYEKGALAQALGPSAGRVGLGAPPLPQPAAPPRSPTAPPQPVEKSFLLGLGPSSTIASHAKRTDVVE